MACIIGNYPRKILILVFLSGIVIFAVFLFEFVAFFLWWNKETCKDYCDTCPEPEECVQDFIAPEDFFIDGEAVEVGQQKEVYLDEDAWDPEDCDKTLIWSSADPSIATVDANGVVTGIRPGTVEITAVAALNPDLSMTVEFEVTDNLKVDQDITDRELEKILAEIPAFVAETTELPEPWNTTVEVEIAIGSNVLDKFEVAEPKTKAFVDEKIRNYYHMNGAKTDEEMKTALREPLLPILFFSYSINLL